MEGGGIERLEHVLEVERIRTNIGHIRVKTSGTSFPDRVEAGIQLDKLHYIYWIPAGVYARRGAGMTKRR